MAQLELAPNELRADLINKLAMGMPIVEHALGYQQFVDTSTLQSLIAVILALDNKRGMGFGARLLGLIEKSDWENQRRFAIEALGWPESSGPQRISNYITKDRAPKDRKVLRKMAELLKTTPDFLLNEGSDDELRDILLQLLELAGTPDDKADTIASAFFGAKRLLAVYQAEGEPPMTPRVAARSAWHLQSPQAPGT